MGALIGGPIADKFGRKWSIFGWCLVLHVGLIVQMTAPHPKWYQVSIFSFSSPSLSGAEHPNMILRRGEEVPKYSLAIALPRN